MTIKSTNLQAGLCDATAAQVTQSHQILEGNEDSYSCLLPKATAESMTYDAKAVQTQHFLEVFGSCSWGEKSIMEARLIVNYLQETGEKPVQTV